jgi:hypothetical protein
MPCGGGCQPGTGSRLTFMGEGDLICCTVMVMDGALHETCMGLELGTGLQLSGNSYPGLCYFGT